MFSKKRIAGNIRNIPGWKSSRKIVVFESDDWGSIRMPSIEAYERLEKAGVKFHRKGSNRYSVNDTLASSEDLENLFHVLGNSKNAHGTSPVFTAMTIVANPDFTKIKESKFSNYFFEPFTETLKRYPGCEKSFELWKEGMKNKLFVPQLHGREHLNVWSWMRALQNNVTNTRLAFDEGLWSFAPDETNAGYTYYQQAFNLKERSEIEQHKIIIKSGLELFEKLFGYKATYFVPPNALINNKLNATLYQGGIKFRSTSTIQREPIGDGIFKKRLHYLGQKEKNGIRYIIRNCTFEPNLKGVDWVNNCLAEINTAFKWKNPAIITTHRVNYIGALNKSNRDYGLQQLNLLLQSIIKKWPDVEFMTTAQLGELMVSK